MARITYFSNTHTKKTKYLSKHRIRARNLNLFLSDIWLSLEWHMFSTNAGRSIAIKILEKSFKCHFIFTTDLSQKAEKQCGLILMTQKNTHKLGFQELKQNTIRSSQNQYVPQFFFKATVNT